MKIWLNKVIAIAAILALCIGMMSTLAACGGRFNRRLADLKNYKLNIDDASAVGIGRKAGDTKDYLVKATMQNTGAPLAQNMSFTSDEAAGPIDFSGLAETETLNEYTENIAIEKIQFIRTKTERRARGDGILEQEDIPARIKKLKVAGGFIFIQFVPVDAPVTQRPHYSGGAKNAMTLIPIDLPEDENSFDFVVNNKSKVLVAEASGGQIYELPEKWDFKTDKISNFNSGFTRIQDDGVVWISGLSEHHPVILSVNAKDELEVRLAVTNSDILETKALRSSDGSVIIQSNINSGLSNGIAHTTDEIFSTTDGRVVSITTDSLRPKDGFARVWDFSATFSGNDAAVRLWENGTFRDLAAGDNFVATNFGEYAFTVVNGVCYSAFAWRVDGANLFWIKHGETEESIVYTADNGLSAVEVSIGGGGLIYYLQRITEITPAGTRIYNLVFNDDGDFVELQLETSRTVDEFQIRTLQPLV
ncbi:MAG: hypothetical protein FWE62_00585 [Firmicutes bacterium]|nr:hypothetical protein [Bacillota bacterium]